MNVEEIRSYCIDKPNAEEGFPFGPDTLVFKIAGKIFLLLSLDSDPPQFNAKCDPELAVQLRDEFDSVKPGYHMNKKHWNTVLMDGRMPNVKIKELIDHSYDLVKPKQRETKKAKNTL